MVGNVGEKGRFRACSAVDSMYVSTFDPRYVHTDDFDRIYAIYGILPRLPSPALIGQDRG